MTWIDVTVPLRHHMVHWPKDPPVEISLEASMDAGDAANLTKIAMSAHTGTHMDAPKHFVRDGAGIDQMPLEAVMGPARVIEIRADIIDVASLEPHEIQRGERLLFKTRNSSLCWSRFSCFLKDFVHVNEAAAKYLVSCGAQTVGVDYLSVGGYRRDGVETHQALLRAGVWVIEGLDLSAVQPGSYELLCLPLKIEGADGAPARALLRPR
jgi:arylformamidase